MRDQDNLKAALKSAQEALAEIATTLDELDEVERKVEANLAQGRELLAAGKLLDAEEQAKVRKIQADMEQTKQDVRAQRAELKVLQANMEAQCQDARQALKRLGLNPEAESRFEP